MKQFFHTLLTGLHLAADFAIMVTCLYVGISCLMGYMSLTQLGDTILPTLYLGYLWISGLLWACSIVDEASELPCP